MAINPQTLFEAAVNAGASDVHLYVSKPPIHRIDGALVELPDAPVSQKDMLALLDRMISAEQRRRFDTERDLEFSYAVDGARFRVNIFMERGNVSLVARIIPTFIPSFKDLGIPDIVADLIQSYNGLILITGPTGSGKSTTLASIIERINNERAVNVITLEDPIEFAFSPKKSVIRQRELGPDLPTFADGLKHLLRQDPNVIMVGEMRDAETMATALTLAETGHLVFSTLHTPSAAQAIDRILDSFPPHQQGQIRSQMALSLNAVIAQQLLPRQGGGRVAAREVLINIPATANLIRENKIAQIPNVMQTHASSGMFNFTMNLRELVSQGLVSQEIADGFKAPTDLGDE